jgi:predicted transcriptional regulator
MNNEDKIYDLLEKVYIELQDTKKELGEVKENQISMQGKLNNLDKKVDTNHSKTIDNFNEIKDQIHELDTKNTANHIATNTRLDKVSDDLEFLTHKEFQAEKEIFRLKKKIVK